MRKMKENKKKIKIKPNNKKIDFSLNYIYPFLNEVSQFSFFFNFCHSLFFFLSFDFFFFLYLLLYFEF